MVELNVLYCLVSITSKSYSMISELLTVLLV